jgi:hypothetical protein
MSESRKKYLEDVTLALQVQLVVQMTVNLLGLTVLAQQTAQNTLTADPDNLNGHTGVRRTLALTYKNVNTCTKKILHSSSHVMEKNIPKPVWRPLARASEWRTARAREWTTSGFLRIKPFLMSLWTLLPVENEHMDSL